MRTPHLVKTAFTNVVSSIGILQEPWLEVKQHHLSHLQTEVMALLQILLSKTIPFWYW